jgi:hypothetical protein
VLVHYGAEWESVRTDSLKNIFSFTIDNGLPKLYAREQLYLTTKDENIRLNDGQWHHIAVSMPKAHCNLSEVQLYINGRNVETVTSGNDEALFFIAYGHLSLGGLGYSSTTYDDRFRNWTDYRGLMDEFIVWGRKITISDIAWSMHKNFEFHYTSICDDNNVTNKLVLKKSAKNPKCLKRCIKLAKCVGFQRKQLSNGFDECTLYFDRPSRGPSMRSSSLCAILK